MALPELSEQRIQNTILATTTANVMPKIVNNAINHHPGIALFTGRLGADEFGPSMMAGAFHQEKSGESIEVRAKLAKSDSFRMMANGYEEFSRDTQDTARVLRANWKQGGGTAILSGKERRNNSGEAKIADLWQYKMEEAADSSVDDVAPQVFSGDGVLELTGLDSIISSGDSLQGISGTNYANWNSLGVSDKGTAAASISFSGGSFATTGVDNWIKAWMNASEGGVGPDLTITTENIYRYYEGSLAPQVRYAGISSGDAKFQRITFHGKPVLHDSYATSGASYFLNGRYLFCATAPGANFDVTPMDAQQFQDVFSSKVLFQGNLVCSARKFQNKVTGQTA